jgi:hypothetical protein
VVTCDNGEGPDSILDGFTLSNGNAYEGGGMFNLDSNPTVTGCTFINNRAGTNGGGMFNRDSNPTVIGCMFFNNRASNYGGGMYNWNESPQVTHCTFSCNWADKYEGGGMYNRNSSPTLTHCTFDENSAYGAGGMYNMYSSPMLADCIFKDNRAQYDGGGIINNYGVPMMANCIFSGNKASMNNGRGGGMWNVNCDSIIINCTFLENSAGEKGGGMVNWESDPKVTNCILWRDHPDEFFIYNGSHSFITYSCILGGWSGTGNIDTDPLFVDAMNGDVHLSFPSPCKDTGDNAAAGLPSKDFEGDPRVAFGTVDMGADEFHTHLYYTGDAAPGGKIEAKFVGLPGTTPVGLWLGSNVLDPPLPTMFGAWYIAPPWIGPITLGPIPSPKGVLVLPATVHREPPAPYDIFMQALIGLDPDSLTNLCVLEVR